MQCINLAGRKYAPFGRIAETLFDLDRQTASGEYLVSNEGCYLFTMDGRLTAFIPWHTPTMIVTAHPDFSLSTGKRHIRYMFGVAVGTRQDLGLEHIPAPELRGQCEKAMDALKDIQRCSRATVLRHAHKNYNQGQ